MAHARRDSRHSLWRCGIALALALGGCPRRPPAEATTPAVAVADAPVAVSPPQDAGTVARADGGAGRNDALARRLGALADRIVADVARARGLAVRGPIARGVMGRDAIVARLRARTAQEYGPGEVAREGQLLRRLGMIPQGMDYEATLYDLLEEQVLGFYDPDLRRLYIADWVPEAAQATTMAHELTHALQDQHFDIGRYTHHQQGRGDAQTAAMAVLEGDATATMLEFALRPSGRSVRDAPEVVRTIEGQLESTDQPRLAAAPRALRETLLFPYVSGLRMCIARLQDDGWPGVDALLQRPPESTEQVMHPDKLAAREMPVVVSEEVPAPLRGQWAVAYQDVLGEFGARQFFRAVLSEARSDAAARGWGGDRAMLLVPRDRVTDGPDGGISIPAEALADDMLVWTVVMDPGAPRDDAEAREFAAGAAEVLARRHIERPITRVAGALAARDLGGARVSLVAQSGRRVLVAERVPTAVAAALVRAVLSP